MYHGNFRCPDFFHTCHVFKGHCALNSSKIQNIVKRTFEKLIKVKSCKIHFIQNRLIWMRLSFSYLYRQIICILAWRRSIPGILIPLNRSAVVYFHQHDFSRKEFQRITRALKWIYNEILRVVCILLGMWPGKARYNERRVHDASKYL